MPVYILQEEMPLDEFHNWIRHFELENEAYEQQTANRPSSGKNKVSIGRKEKPPRPSTATVVKEIPAQSPASSPVGPFKKDRNGKTVVFEGTVGRK